MHAGIPSPLVGGTPWEGGPPGTMHPQTMRPPGTEHAGRYGERAAGTHPTGMQSCDALNSLTFTDSKNTHYTTNV